MFFIGSREPFEKGDLKRLQYELLHRFGDLFWLGADEKKPQDFISSSDRTSWGEDSQWPFLYEIDSGVRYYGEGYTRGPGGNIAMLLIFLVRCLPKCGIYYFGDCDGGMGYAWDEQRAYALLQYWCDSGKHSYQRAMTIGNTPAEGSVICDFCMQPMNRSGWGPEYAEFYCAGCGQAREFHGEEAKPFVYK